MAISSIHIKNYKSLEDIKIDIKDEDITCFLGKNGSGKSNILNALKYFYDYQNKPYSYERVIDIKNPYKQYMEISIIYDFTNLLKKRKSKYIEESRENMQNYFFEGFKIQVKMTQYKNGEIKWYPNDSKVIKDVFSYFPMYYVNTRNIELTNWEYLWYIVADMAKKPLEIPYEEYMEGLDNLLEKSYGEKYKKSFEIVNNIFIKEKINLNQYNYNKNYENILIARFGGKEFQGDGDRLEYYSDGLNSFKFLKILLQILSKLTPLSLKEPFIIIDEPEIGLHTSYIYELVKNIKENVTGNQNLFIATHSSDFICEIMKNDMKLLLFRLDIKHNYTVIERMNALIEDNEKHRLTINEVKCYFANAIVAVEGASDIQVFTNRNIRELFPKLDNIEFYQMNSNNKTFGFIFSNKRKHTIAILTIVDMDKIIKANKDVFDEEFVFKINQDKDLNPLSEKYETFGRSLEEREKLYFYSNKKKEKKPNYDKRKGVLDIIENSKFMIGKSQYALSKRKYFQLIYKIKEYCRLYDVYPFRTTIEGALVNEVNYKDFIEWLSIKHKSNEEKLKKLLEEYKENTESLITILRLISNGKLDNLIAPSKDRFKDIYIKINDLNVNIGKKTDGWIDDWLDYYFKKKINDIRKVSDKKKLFEEDFPELYETLNRIEKLI